MYDSSCGSIQAENRDIAKFEPSMLESSVLQTVEFIGGRDLDEGRCLDSWSLDIEISAWYTMTRMPSHQVCTRYLCFHTS